MGRAVLKKRIIPVQLLIDGRLVKTVEFGAYRDVGDPVTEDYPGERPYHFTGGTIKRVAIDVSGEPYIDLEREAAGMLMRE